MKTTHSILIDNKRIPYFLTPQERKTEEGESVTLFECPAAKINQTFLNEDIAELLRDLPSLIEMEKQHARSQDQVIRFRVSGEEKIQIEKNALEKGFKNISQFLRQTALNA